MKHLIRIYSYTYHIDYLKGNLGYRSNEADARSCNKTDWEGSAFILDQYTKIFNNSNGFNPLYNIICFD